MKRQSRAMRVIRGKILYTIGGYENAIEDGHIEQLPTRDVLVDEVYGEIIRAPGWEEIQNKDLRFITAKKLKQMIDGGIEVYFINERDKK